MTGTDLQSPSSRGCSSKYRPRESRYARQHEHENCGCYDNGVSSSNILRSFVCHAITALGRAIHYRQSVLDLLGVHDTHDYSCLPRLAWHYEPGQAVGESQAKEEELRGNDRKDTRCKKEVAIAHLSQRQVIQSSALHRRIVSIKTWQVAQISYLRQ